MNNIEKYMIDPEKYIPKGIYCYDDNGKCPFWSIDKDKYNQLLHLNRGNSISGTNNSYIIPSRIKN